MRLHHIFAAAALLASQPASADISARYELIDSPSEALLVQVNERGDSRIVLPTEGVSLTIGGVSYLVGSDDQGTYAIRWDDLIEVMASARDSATGSEAETSDQSAFTVTSGGQEIVAGRAGEIWTFRRQGRGSERAVGVVVSRDPALLPLGRAIASYILRTLQLAQPILGGRTDLLPRDVLRDVLERGTVLRLGQAFRIGRVDTARLPDEAFQLPVQPMAREEILPRLMRRRIRRTERNLDARPSNLVQVPSPMPTER